MLRTKSKVVGLLECAAKWEGAGAVAKIPKCCLCRVWGTSLVFKKRTRNLPPSSACCTLLLLGTYLGRVGRPGSGLGRTRAAYYRGSPQ